MLGGEWYSWRLIKFNIWSALKVSFRKWKTNIRRSPWDSRETRFAEFNAGKKQLLAGSCSEPVFSHTRLRTDFLILLKHTTIVASRMAGINGGDNTIYCALTAWRLECLENTFLYSSRGMITCPPKNWLPLDQGGQTWSNPIWNTNYSCARDAISKFLYNSVMKG